MVGPWYTWVTGCPGRALVRCRSGLLGSVIHDLGPPVPAQAKSGWKANYVRSPTKREIRERDGEHNDLSQNVARLR